VSVYILSIYTDIYITYTRYMCWYIYKVYVLVYILSKYTKFLRSKFLRSHFLRS
jgi:hypothetical protein